MEKQNGHGLVTIGELHNNAQRVSTISDLNVLRSQLERWKREAADEKNAKAEMGEALGKINRMVGGNGWEKPQEVIASVANKLATLSESTNDAEVVTLREQLALNHKQLKEAQGSARAALTKLHTETTEFNKMREKYEAQQEELARMGAMQVTASKPMADEERDALLTLLDMERADHGKLIQEILQASANAASEVVAGLQSEKNSSRGLKAMNYGIKLGVAAVESAITRAIHGIKPTEPA
jgi:hypothetical protein